MPLFRQGLPVDEIAGHLSRATSTVQGYLIDYLKFDRVTDPEPWVDAATAARIRDAAEVVGTEMLRPIRDRLGEEISYDAIRVVIECLRNRQSILPAG